MGGKETWALLADASLERLASSILKSVFSEQLASRILKSVFSKAMMPLDIEWLTKMRKFCCDLSEPAEGLIDTVFERQSAAWLRHIVHDIYAMKPAEPCSASQRDQSLYV